MAATNVIVQGLPWDHYLRCCNDDSDGICINPTNKLKTELEELLQIYGPVSCCYLWCCDSTKDEDDKGYVHENFAHVIFENTEHASRACEAANNREIRLEKYKLSLTLISDSWAPIDNLVDDCLTKIFRLLDPKDRVTIERVCHRWKNVVTEHGWCHVKSLDLTAIKNQAEFKAFLKRSHMYIEEIIADTKSYPLLNAILKDCPKVMSLKLKFNHEVSDNEWVTLLKDIRRLTLDINRPIPSTLVYTFIDLLPKCIEKMDISICGWNMLSIAFNIADFKSLQHLTLRTWQPSRLIEGALRGIEDLNKLTTLSLFKIALSDTDLEEIGNCTQLRTLTIPKIGLSDNILMKILKNNRNLESLDVSGNSKITDDSLQYISTLPHLKRLELAGCTAVAFAFMKEIQFFEYLNCSQCVVITNELLQKLLLWMPKLKLLNIEHCSVTEEFVTIAHDIVQQRECKLILKIATSIQPYNMDSHIRYLSSGLLKVINPEWRETMADVDDLIGTDYYDSDGDIATYDSDVEYEIF